MARCGKCRGKLYTREGWLLEGIGLVTACRGFDCSTYRTSVLHFDGTVTSRILNPGDEGYLKAVDAWYDDKFK